MTALSEVTLRLFRFEPGIDEVPRYEDYTVPYSEHMRVLDALNYVYEEMGGKLAYRWYCGTKKCGECAITVNGKPMLACWEPATEHMTCEPLANFPIIRDLVVDTAPYEQLIMGLKPLLTRSRNPTFPERIGHAEMAPAHRLSKCIECNVCTAAVPVKDIGAKGIDWEGYAGPAALVRFARFALDPRDETERKSLADKAGLGSFPLYEALDGVCPQGIDIVADALVPVRRQLLGLDGAGKDATAASTVFIAANEWSAFVRLADAHKRELEESGHIRRETIPGISEAYSLAER